MLKKALISTGIMTLILINIFLWPYLLQERQGSTDANNSPASSTYAPGQDPESSADGTAKDNTKKSDGDSSNTDPESSAGTDGGSSGNPAEDPAKFRIINIE